MLKIPSALGGVGLFAWSIIAVFQNLDHSLLDHSSQAALGIDYWTTVSFVMPTESVAPPLKRDTADSTRNVYTKKSINFEKLSERYEVMAEKGSPLLVLIDKEYGPLRHWKETAKLLKQAKDNDFLIPISELSDTMFRKLEQYRRPIGNPDQAKVLVSASQAVSISIDGTDHTIIPQSSSTKEIWDKLAEVHVEDGQESSRKSLKEVVPEVDMAYRVRPGRYGDEVEIAERLQDLLERESRSLEAIIDELLPKGASTKLEMRLDELPGEQKSALIEKLRNEARQGNLTDLQIEAYLTSNPKVQIQQFVTMVISTGERSRFQVPLYSSYRRSPK